MKHPIYKFLKENNLTQKSEVDFINEYSNPQKSAELYKFFAENNLTSKSEDDFYQEYFNEEKKNFFLDSSKESTGPQKQPTTPSAKPTPKAPLPSTSNELLYTGALKGFGGETKQGKKIQETANRVKEEQKKPEISDIEEIDITEKSDAISAPKFADPVVTKQGADLSKTLFYERSKNTDVFKIPTPGESKEYAEKITENYLDYLSDFEPDKAENLRNAYNALITKPKNERTAQDERFLRDLQSDAIDMDVKSKDHRIDQIFNRIGELQKTAVNQDGIKELNDLYGEYYKTKNNIQGAIGAYNLNRRSYGLAEGDEFEEQRIKRERFERLEKGEGKASEFFRGIGGAILRGSVSIAQVPKVLGDLVGDTDYDWADELYNSIEGGKNTMERDFGAPLPEGKTWSDLPFMARAASVGGNALGSAGLYATGGGLFGGASKLSQGVATFGTAFLTSEADYYQEAIDAGMDNQDAAFFGSWMAAQTAFLESLIPDVKYLSTDPFRKSVRNGFIDGIKSGATKAESIKLAFKNSIKALPESAFERIKTGTKETFVEEFPQQLAEDISKTAVNSMGQKEYFNDTFNPDAYVDAIIGSYVATTGLSIFSRPQSKSPVQEELIREVVERKDDLFEKGTATDKKTQPEYKKEVEKAAELLSAMKSHSSWNNLSREEQNHALAIAQQAEIIKEEQEQMKKIGVEDESKNLELQKIDKELKDIFSIQRGREIEAEKEQKRKELEDEFNQSLSQEYDKKDQTGLPSQVGEGQKPIETQPIQGAGAETTETSGVLQAPEEVTEPLKDVESTAKALEGVDINRILNLEKNEYGHYSTKINNPKNIQFISDRMRLDYLLNPSEKINVEDFTKAKRNKLNQDNDFVYVKETPTHLVMTEEWTEGSKRGLRDKYGDDSFEIIESKIIPRIKDFASKVGLKFVSHELKGKDSVFIFEKQTPQSISEAYHRAKKDDSNPELVQAVEQLLGKPKEATPTTEAAPEEVTPQATTVSEVVEEKPAPKPQTSPNKQIEYVANKSRGKQKGVTNNVKGGLSEKELFILEKELQQLEKRAVEEGSARFDSSLGSFNYEKVNGKEEKINVYEVDGYTIEYGGSVKGGSWVDIITPQKERIRIERSQYKNQRGASTFYWAAETKETEQPTPPTKPQTTEETTQAQMEFPEPTERNDENINALLEKKRKYNSLPKKSKPLATNLLNEIRSMAKDMGIEVTFAAGFEIRLTDKKTGKNITKRGVDRTVNKDRNQVRQAALSAAGDGMLGMYARVMLWFRSGGKILTSQSELGKNTREMEDAKKRGYIGDDGASAEMAAEQLVEDVLGVDPEFASEYVYDNDIVSLFQDFLAEYGSSSKEDIENGIIDIYLRNAEEQNEEAKGRFEMEYGKGALGFLNQDIKLEEIESKIQEETPQPKSTQSSGEDSEFSFGGREPDFRRVKGPTERGEAVSGAEAVKMVENFLKASGINVRVLNDKDFDALLGKKGYSVDADGVFMTNDNTGEVLIRRSGLESKYGDVIVFHEGIHPVINIIRNTDPKLYNAIVQGIKNEAKTNKKIQGIISEVERVMEGEPAPAVEDEIVTEVFARIASGDVKLSEIKKSLAEKIIYYANKIAKLLGLNKRIGINPSDIEFRDFANGLTNALRQGGSITDVVGRGKEKEFINEKTKDGRTITTNQEGSFISESGNAQYSRRGIVRGEKDKGGSADTTVKNVWNQYKGIKFNGSLKIEDASDVAHIMRQLENKAVEHAFAVHVDKNGKPHIQFLGMGGVASTTVDKTLILAGAKRYNSKKIYLVHNHPSGSMTPSRSDIVLTNDIREMFAGLKIPIEHVILDTYKKEFVHIDISGYASVESRDERKEADEKYLRSLKTEMMDEFEVLSAPLAKVTSSRDTAQFFTQMRFTALPKNGMLVMDRQNHVIGNYILPGGFNYKDVTDNMVGAGVGQGVIFYSNQDNYKDIGPIKKGLEAAGISVLDYILVDSNSQSVNDFYKSYADEGLLKETQQEYGTTPVEKQKAQFSRKMDRDMAVTPSGETVKTKPLPEGLAIINGFYSPIEKNLMEYGKDKIKAKDWLNVVGKGDEAVFTGVRAFLEGKDPNAMVSKQEILDYMKDNRISVVEVVKGVDDFTDQSKWKKRASGDGVWETTASDGTKLTIDASEGEGTLYIYADGNEIGSEEYSPEEDLLDLGIQAIGSLTDYSESPTKFPEYQLEGEKENYKEVLVTLPKKKIKFDGFEISETDTVVYEDRGTSKPLKIVKVIPKKFSDASEEASKYIRDNSYKHEYNLDYNDGESIIDALEKAGVRFDKTNFESTHFDEPNILVHLRMNTRTDADGKKVLFLEEIQSDWGQQGKKRGFDNIDYNSELDKAKKSLSDLELKLDDIWEKNKGKYNSRSELRKNNKEFDELASQYAPLTQKVETLTRERFMSNEQKVPTAPFVMDTNAWTKLGLKVALKEAVAQGVDKIAWTTGEQQNDRYDLRKQVDNINYYKNENGTYRVYAMKDGGTVFSEDNLSESQLEPSFGKDVAQKIINNEGIKPEGFKGKRLEGNDLKIGGKGMKGFYGSIEEGTKGIVGGVAEKLSGQELGETKIEIQEQDVKLTENEFDISKAPKELQDLLDKYEEGIADGDYAELQKFSKEAAEIGYEIDYDLDGTITTFKRISGKPKLSTQPSIDITPEIKAEVLQGQAQFSRKMSRDLSEEERNQSIEGVKTEMARIEDSISEGADPQTAYDELFATQDYADISMDLRMKVNAAIKRAYPNVTTAENIARGLTQSYEKKEAKVADVLRNDRDLAYIYRNFPSIIDQLKENKVIEIEGDCV